MKTQSRPFFLLTAALACPAWRAPGRRSISITPARRSSSTPWLDLTLASLGGRSCPATSWASAANGSSGKLGPLSDHFMAAYVTQTEGVPDRIATGTIPIRRAHVTARVALCALDKNVPPPRPADGGVHRSTRGACAPQAAGLPEGCSGDAWPGVLGMETVGSVKPQ
jgi:hypothetical protein